MATKHFGWKLHFYDIPADLFSISMKSAMASIVSWVIAATFTRMSLLWFYKRMVDNTYIPWFHWSLIASQVLVISYGLVATTVTIFGCR